MSWIPIVFLAVILLVGLGLAASKNSAQGKIGFPYSPRSPLFSTAERSFLGVLDKAVGSEHRVFGKVRVADIAQVKPGLNRSARQGALNKIASKHFDYVVCHYSDLSVVCVVELNDKSHASKRAQARDKFIDGVCDTIRVPLLKIPAKRSYSVDDISKLFLAAVQPDSGGTNNLTI
jgi:Protein of unknown function (DUF2726)